jgi:SAM-dependent methyltransferase
MTEARAGGGTAGRYVEAPDYYLPDAGDPPAVFLAGGITGVGRWHDHAASVLASAATPVVVLNPNRVDFPIHDPGSGWEQVSWEQHHLHLPGVVTLFWFPASDPRTTTQPVAMFELGQALGEGRPVVVGAHPEYPRQADVHMLCELSRPGLSVHTRLDDVLAATLGIVAELGQDLTRTYDAVAAAYAERFAGELATEPLDRGLLAAFADLVLAAGGGPVADLGCGPGHVGAHLRELGLDVFGVDLSPGMVAEARDRHPGMRFDVGSLLALDLPDAALAGACAFYSLIHLPTGDLPAAFAELSRVLRPGGQALLAFQAGDDVAQHHRGEWLGQPDVELTLWRRRPEHVTALLAAAGLHVHATLVRAPDGTESVDRAYLLARRTP